MNKEPSLNINIVRFYDSGEVNISLSADIWMHSKANFKDLKAELEAVIERYSV